MSIKLKVSATDQQELNEILDLLQPVIRKRNYRVKRKPPTVSSNKLIAYIETRNSCRYMRDVVQ